MLATLVLQEMHQSPQRRAAAIAARFERANDALIGAIERCPWPGPAARGWSALAEARRVAEQQVVLARFVEAVAAVRPLPSLRDVVAAEREPRGTGAAVDRADTLDLLRCRGAAAARILRGLDDAQLAAATSYFGARLTAAQLVDELLIAPLDELVGAVVR
jgi:hypothetical protein